MKNMTMPMWEKSPATLLLQNPCLAISILANYDIKFAFSKRRLARRSNRSGGAYIA